MAGCRIIAELDNGLQKPSSNLVLPDWLASGHNPLKVLAEPPTNSPIRTQASYGNAGKRDTISLQLS